MRVGIIGSGDVGRALGRGFAAKGHDVMIGSRTPSSEPLSAWKAESGGRRSTGTFAQAARHGEVLVLAVHGVAAEAAIDLAGPSNLAGKLLIDATNPLDFSHGMPPALFTPPGDSLGERVQRRAPAAKVVKCFNIVPNSLMVDPNVPGGPPDMIICGNDPAAKEQLVGILRSFGWAGAIDIGGIEGARWTEALVPLWVRVCGALNNWNVAFKVLQG
jgi:predicted dinucleotide-binding enzyme